MAHALRTIWLDEEPADTQTVQPRPRRPRQPGPMLWQRPLPMLGLIAAVVAVAMLFIHGKDSIAQQDFQRRALRQEFTQLDRECVQLNLELDRLAAEPLPTEVAEQPLLALPDTDRIHFARVTEQPPTVDGQPTQVAARRPLPQRVAEGLRDFWHRVSVITVKPAYAQE